MKDRPVFCVFFIELPNPFLGSLQDLLILREFLLSGIGKIPQQGEKEIAVLIGQVVYL